MDGRFVQLAALAADRHGVLHRCHREIGRSVGSTAVRVASEALHRTAGEEHVPICWNAGDLAHGIGSGPRRPRRVGRALRAIRRRAPTPRWISSGLRRALAAPHRSKSLRRNPRENQFSAASTRRRGDCRWAPMRDGGASDPRLVAVPIHARRDPQRDRLCHSVASCQRIATAAPHRERSRRQCQAPTGSHHSARRFRWRERTGAPLSRHPAPGRLSQAATTTHLSRRHPHDGTSRRGIRRRTDHRSERPQDTCLSTSGTARRTAAHRAHADR